MVEDEDMLRDLICETLGMHKYKVLEARDGSEALRVGDQHKKPLDLLLSDVVLPKMGGRELAERLARSHPEMEVIFMSGYTENGIVHDGVLDTGINFIHKPFTVKELIGKVREVLAG
ncbi:MAG: response regulator [Desulfobaccales bacterium]